MPEIVTLFGSSGSLPADSAGELAYAAGRELALRGLTLCNGGYGGAMEASARGAKEAGGRTIGITTAESPSRANAYIDEEIRVATHVERLLKLVALGSGYVVLPGGTGTLLECAAVLEFVNKGLMGEKPLVFLGEFWMPLLDLVRGKGLLDATGVRTGWFISIGDPAGAAEFIVSRLAGRSVPRSSAP